MKMQVQTFTHRLDQEEESDSPRQSLLLQLNSLCSVDSKSNCITAVTDWYFNYLPAVLLISSNLLPEKRGVKLYEEIEVFSREFVLLIKEIVSNSKELELLGNR